MNIVKKIILSLKDFFWDMLNIKQKNKSSVSDIPVTSNQYNNHYTITRYKQKKFMTDSDWIFLIN